MSRLTSLLAFVLLAVNSVAEPTIQAPGIAPPTNSVWLMFTPPPATVPIGFSIVAKWAFGPQSESTNLSFSTGQNASNCWYVVNGLSTTNRYEFKVEAYHVDPKGIKTNLPNWSANFVWPPDAADGYLAFGTPSQRALREGMLKVAEVVAKQIEAENAAGSGRTNTLPK